MPPEIREIDDIESEEQFEQLSKSLPNKLLVLDFYASWCGNCRMIYPHVKRFQGEYKNTVFKKVDVDDLDDLALSWGIQAMPTFVFLINGEEVHRITGSNPQKLKASLDEWQPKVPG